jgi:hypothetical protein
MKETFLRVCKRSISKSTERKLLDKITASFIADQTIMQMFLWE